MCGIYGILFLRNKNIKAVAVKTILRKLMVESEARGTDATGLSFVRKNNAIIYKHDVKASEFLKLRDTRKVIKRGLEESTEEDRLFSVIGHTRQETQGSHVHQHNNHPIRFGSIIGVHNGAIFNDDSIFSELKLKRIGQVDSEAIFAGIASFGSKYKKTPLKVKSAPITEAIADISEKLSGSMACAMQDVENPKAVWLFRRSNPLKILYFKREGMIIFASEEKFILNSVDNLALESPESIELLPNSGICFNLLNNKFNRFGPLAMSNSYL